MALADTNSGAEPGAESGTTSLQDQIDSNPVDEGSVPGTTIEETGQDVTIDQTSRDDDASGRDPPVSTGVEPEESAAEPEEELTSKRAGETEGAQVASRNDVESSFLDGSGTEAEASDGPAAESTIEDAAGVTGVALAAVSIGGESEPETISAIAAARALLINGDESETQAIEADGAKQSEALKEPPAGEETEAKETPGADAPATGDTEPSATLSIRAS